MTNIINKQDSVWKAIMIIDRKNQNLIDKGEICFHDLLMKSFHFNPKDREINMIISDSNQDRFSVTFINVFDFCYTNSNTTRSRYYEVIMGWEEIPNEYTRDFLIEEIKKTYVINGAEWNDELFAIRVLMNNMSEIKIVCERILIEKYNEFR